MKRRRRATRCLGPRRSLRLAPLPARPKDRQNRDDQDIDTFGQRLARRILRRGGIPPIRLRLEIGMEAVVDHGTTRSLAWTLDAASSRSMPAVAMQTARSLGPRWPCAASVVSAAIGAAAASSRAMP